MSFVWIEKPDDVSFSRNEMPVQFEYVGSHRAELEIYQQESTEFILITTLHASPDVNGRYYFDISQVLDDILIIEFPDDTIANKDTKRLKKYTLKAIPYNSSGNQIMSSILGGLIALKGGVDPNTNFPFLGDYYSNSKLPFLTWFKEQRVIPSQQNFLYFRNFYSQNLTLKLLVEVYYTDGSTNYFFLDQVLIEAGDLWYFPVGHDDLELGDLAPTKEIAYYEVCLNNNTDYTERIRYYVDHNFHENSRVFLFQNSLGGVDSLNCTGEFTFSNKVSKSQALVNKAIQEFNRKLDRSIKATSSFITEDQFKHAIDLLLGDAVEVKGSKYFPISIDKGSTFSLKESDVLFYIAFSYDYAKESKSYTREIEW